VSALAWRLAMAALIALPAAAIAQAPLPERQSVLSVRVLAEGEPMNQSRPDRINSFYRQTLVMQSGITFDIPAEAMAALRDRYRLGEHDYFLLSEWLALAPGTPSRHLAYLYCAAHIRWFRGLFDTCFRDADGDGRLEAVAVFDRLRFPPQGISFEPIEPIPYHFVQSARVLGPRRRGNDYLWPGLGIAWNVDRDSGHLHFYAQALDQRLRADIDPPVDLDPATLPATIEIAGARLTVLSWDGHRPTVRLDRPFTDRPIRLMSPDDYLQLIMGGSRHGWRMEISDVPLPGAPPPPVTTLN
jgi:hypothetical protein